LSVGILMLVYRYSIAHWPCNLAQSHTCGSKFLDLVCWYSL